MSRSKTKGRFELRVDPVLLQAVKDHCQQRGISVAQLVTEHFKFITAVDSAMKDRDESGKERAQHISS